MSHLPMGHDAVSPIDADWGTSNLRLWPMSSADQVLEARRSDAGTGKLARDVFEPALLDCIGDCLSVANSAPARRHAGGAIAVW